jgi:ATP-dependent RNA helicase DeaD
MGFEEATSIQEQTIPVILEGKDVIGQSQTGTGKTAAFAIPALEKINESLKEPQVLILCPTRELAVQVANEFGKIGKHYRAIHSVAVYGGEPINKQIRELRRGAQVIIGTPGRTLDHISRRTIKTNNIKTLILDEADEMLKMGFREDIEEVIEKINDDRQTILFSATMPQSILDIINKYQDNPTLIKVKSTGLTTKTVQQQYALVKKRFKLEALYRTLNYYQPKRGIIFCNTKSMVDDLNDALQAKGYSAEKIHGDLKQELRLNVLNRFNDGIINMLIATDVAARGIDIQNVDVVVNYDIPDKEDNYVHRIGRSGRAGKEGKSISIVTKSDMSRLKRIEYYIKKKIDKVDVPSGAEVHIKKIEHFTDSLARVIENEDLGKYKDVLVNLVDKGHGIDDIAAALMKNSLELASKDIDNEDVNETARSRNDRNDRRDRNDRSRRDGRDRRDNKDRKTPENMTRIYMNLGRNSRVNPGDILGAITGECSVKGKHVGSIDIYEKFSFFEVENKYADKVIKSLNKSRVKGKKINVEKANSK